MSKELFEKAISGRKLVLFGAGQVASEMTATFLKDYKISYICDNDPNKWETEMNGIPIFSPSKLLDDDKKSILVLITTLDIHKITLWLLENDLQYLNIGIFSHLNMDMINDSILRCPGEYLFERCNNRKVLIFGTGPSARVVAEVLLRKDIHVDYYIDSGSSHTNLDNKVVRHYDDIVFENPDEFFIIVANDEKEDYGISRQRFLELGLTEHINFTYYSDIPAYGVPYYYDVLLAHGRTREEIEGFEVFGDIENPESLKIVTLGGSTTESSLWYIKGWSQFLVDILAEEGIPTILFCGGVSAYNSSQELLKFIRDVLPMKPDIVLSYSGFNDIWRPLFSWSSNLKESMRPFVTEFHEQFFSSVLKYAPPEKQTVLYGLQNSKSKEEVWVDNMRTMHAIANEFGIRFFSFLQPNYFVGDFLLTESQKIILKRRYYNDEYLGYAKNNINTFKREYKALINASKNIENIYDLTNIFSGYTNIYMDACHVTELANRIIAENIYKILEEHLDRSNAE